MMKNRDKFSHFPDSAVVARQQREMTLGVLAFPGQVTIVDQEGKHEAAMFRFLCPYAGAGRKKLLPFGVGAGVKTLYCCDLFLKDELDERMERVTKRDPCQRTRERAKRNLQFYYLELDQRTRRKQSLLTQSGQRLLLQRLDQENIQLVVLDDAEVLTLGTAKEEQELAPASFGELLEELTSRGISVLIFTSGAKGRKATSALLGAVPHNKVYVKEDKRNSMPGGVRLLFSREAAHDASPVPRDFVWWSKIDESGYFDFSCKEEYFDDQKSAVQMARDDLRKRIKVLIAKGVTTQKELAEHLGLSRSTINRGILREMIACGEVLMDPKTKRLSLSASTDNTGDSGDDDSDEASQGVLW